MHVFTTPRRIGFPAAVVLPVLATLVLGASLAGAETRVGGTLQGTVTWTKQGSPYLATEDVVVGRSATLRIGPGVTVRFMPNIATRGGYNDFDLELLVRGKLVVEGAVNDTVLFTSDSEKPRWEDWQGIVLDGPQASVDIRGANLEYAIMGIRVIDGTLVGRNMSIRNCMQHGISLIRGKAELDDVTIRQVGNPGGTGVGINLERQSVVHIRNCNVIGVQNGIIYSQKSGGLLEGGSVSGCISRGIVIHNSTPEIRRCTITGNRIGVIVSGGARPVVKENNIFENVFADVELREFDGEPVKIDFSGNWWGETGLGLIEERILDGVDDPEVKAFTLLEPVLTEAVSSEVPGPDGP